MSDNLKVFDRVYVSVAGFKVKDENGNVLTFTKKEYPTYTVTLTSSGISSQCYVKYNNIKYYTSGQTFSVNENDVVEVYVNYGDRNVISLNGEVVSQGYGQAEYSHTVTSDVEIRFSLSRGQSNVYITEISDITALTITENGTYTASGTTRGYSPVTVNVPATTPTLQSKTATPSETAQTITADSGYDGLSSVAVEAISGTYVGSGVARKTSTDLTGQETEDGFTFTAPTGYYEADATKTIQYGEISVNKLRWSRGEIYVLLDTSSGYLTDSQGVMIEVMSMEDIDNLPMQDSTNITPTETVQTISGNQYLTGDITVEAIPSTYIGSGVTQRTSTDLTANGATITVPSGYYATQATKSVASGTEGMPAASKGTVSNHAISITPSVTNSEGYISGGTKTGTAVSVSASELVSGTYSVTSSGTKDVTNYASVSVPSGSAETPDTTITANPSISVNASGLITATASASKDISPSVSAGYVSSGTAGTVTVSGSNAQQLTTLGATTYNTSTTDQTITSGKYITGTQTIKAVTTSNLTAANVKAGTTIQVGDANDSDRIASVTGTFTSDATASAGDIKSGETAYVNGTKVTGTLKFNTIYTGSSAPSSSLGVDGDIYIQI